jgi:hypothetical protein
MTTVYICSSCDKTSLKRNRIADHVGECGGEVVVSRAMVIPEEVHQQQRRMRDVNIETMTELQKVPYIHSVGQNIMVDKSCCIPYSDLSRRAGLIDNIITRQTPDVFDSAQTFGDILVTIFRLYGGDLAPLEHHFTWTFDPRVSRTNFCVVLDRYTTFLVSKDTWKNVVLDTLMKVLDTLGKSLLNHIKEPRDSYTNERQHIIDVWKSIGKGRPRSQLFNEMDHDAVWARILEIMPVTRPVV